MEKTGKLIEKIITWLLIIVFGLLSLISVIGVSKIDTTYNEYREYAYFTPNNYLVLFIGVFLIVGIFYMINRIWDLGKVSTVKLQVGVTLYVVVLGILWILLSRANPVNDQSIVSGYATKFLNGDFSGLVYGEYLERFTHQLGIVWILQQIYKFAGEGNYQAVMVINVFCMAGIFNMLYKILREINTSKRVHNVYWIMLIMCIAPIFYCVFVYGTIIGLFFGTISIYFSIKYVKKFKIRYILGILAALSIAIIAKENFKIIAVAIICISVFIAIFKKKTECIALVLVSVLCIMSPSILSMHIENISEIEVGRGSPMTLYMAMGLQQGNMSSCGADGWYNMYNVKVYSQVNGDYEEADKIAKENIKENLSEYVTHPVKGAKFAYEKIATQWAEPTFQTFWMTDALGNHGEWSSFTRNAYEGILNSILWNVMKCFMLIIWISNFVFYYKKRKELDVINLFTGIIVFGAFVLHVFWEGKALYIMPYFVISLVAGAEGFSFIIKNAGTKIDMLLDRRRKNGEENN